MDTANFELLKKELVPFGAHLIAVSKTKPAEEIQQLYDAGQRIFGENKVQEMCEKYEVLPKHIQWHLIGHLQTNKVKYIAPFVAMIHSVDSPKLLVEIDKQVAKNGRIIDCLLQVYIAREDTKFGLSAMEVLKLLESDAYRACANIRICGLMGMATNTANREQISREFRSLKLFYDSLKAAYFKDKPYFSEISMGMSSDYQLALQQGATMIRVGSMLFGSRNI
jgi:pyridoxal phosphate enzyme (YggS family)